MIQLSKLYIYHRCYKKIRVPKRHKTALFDDKEGNVSEGRCDWSPRWPGWILHAHGHCQSSFLHSKSADTKTTIADNVSIIIILCGQIQVQNHLNQKLNGQNTYRTVPYVSYVKKSSFNWAANPISRSICARFWHRHVLWTFTSMKGESDTEFVCRGRISILRCHTFCDHHVHSC